MTSVLEQMISLLTAGITGIAEGIGGGLQALVQSIFLVEGTGGVMELSTFGATALIFAGVSLAVGLSVKIFNWLTTLGGSN